MSDLFNKMMQQEEKQRNSMPHHEEHPAKKKISINLSSLKVKETPKVEEVKQPVEQDPFSQKVSRMQKEAPKEVKKKPVARKKPIQEKPIVADANNMEEIEKLFLKSGSSLEFKNNWIAQYQKAHASKKHGVIIDKFKRGKFYINEQGVLNILPEIETHNKSAKDLLKQKWLE